MSFYPFLPLHYRINEFVDFLKTSLKMIMFQSASRQLKKNASIFKKYQFLHYLTDLVDVSKMFLKVPLEKHSSISTSW